jgi:hypothetical protein
VIDRRDSAPNSIWLDFRTHPDAWQERDDQQASRF